MSDSTRWQPVIFPETAMARMAEALRRQPASDYRDHAITHEVLKSLGPQRTVVDIGAGIGRFTVPLAEADCDVWAVEPSAIMREQLAQAVGASPAASRIHTVPEIWPTAAVAPVEVALAAWVIHFSAAPRAFIRAMEAVATRRCVVAIPVEHRWAALQDLWARFHPDRPAPAPRVS
ncbi:class I SAM-dependent methyltransferase [Sulfobacillus harzensis]|uniref:Methyltransferase domain-containing protein n=1 Tax=Sulfobacillus harzensis TaxID=2729629 RepID=A0A7Y0L1I5_9FIRM|nr:methyltransferase domain-containing protein [Sulfobacillus harzensis]NMP21563.1 methyltransferase domain-containing protein [Sulfobacillus harzensis]